MPDQGFGFRAISSEYMQGKSAEPKFTQH